MNLALMGLRGAGKSTVGRLVAARLGLAFVDLDDVTPRLLGYASTGEAWRACGEGAFREAEARALGEVLKRAGQIVALGGGTPLAPGASEVMREEMAEGKLALVYLRAEAGVLRGRLEMADNEHRPSLTGRGVVQEVAEVFASRDPVYRGLASAVVEVAGLTVEEAADRVVELWV